MRYFIILIIILLSTKAGFTQFASDAEEDFKALLAANQAKGIQDSVAYAEIKTAAIILMHRSEFNEALPFLELSFQFTPTDTNINTLLYESLIMKINRQKDPSQNIDDIQAYRTKYPFLKDSVLLSELIYRDALGLIIKTFDSNNLKVINTYFDYANIELSKLENKAILLELPNSESMFFNVAMKNYLAKNHHKSLQILKIGHKYYPKNQDIVTLMNFTTTQLKTKNK